MLKRSSELVFEEGWAEDFSETVVKEIENKKRLEVLYELTRQAQELDMGY